MKNVFKKLKNSEKGITLIVLVITIIILLILAGIAINLSIGENGLFRKAQEGVELYKNASIQEQEKLEEINKIIDGEADFEISNKQEMEEFRDKVNAGETFEGKLVKVIADIDLEEEEWIPIGNYTENQELKFKGIFNGQNHIIKGIKIDTSKDNQGLFGCNEGIIKNINIENCIINSDGAAVGGIVGYNADNASIENCNTISGDISAIGRDTGSIVGGIVGYNIGNVEKCSNYANIKGEYKLIGGICGYNTSGGNIMNSNNYGYVEGSYQIGGIVGDSDSPEKNIIAKVTNCNNYGNVKEIKKHEDIYPSASVGGIVGCNYTYSIIENCINEGIIESNYGEQGGICGSNVYIIKNCENKGEIINTCESDNIGGIGGIAGLSSGTIFECYNQANITSEIGSFIGGIAGYMVENTNDDSYECVVEQCYNTGNVSGNNIIGGIVGRLFSGASIQSCYNIGAITGNNYTGGIAGDTATNSLELKNSYNKGSIIGNNYVGGIAGSIRSILENCYNVGMVNTGGGVCGEIDINYVTADIITNCYYLDTSSQKGAGNEENIGTISGILKKGNTEMQGLASQLGDEFKDNLEGDKYPQLIWE